MSALSVDVVVPTLQEAARLPGLLSRLAWLPVRRVIVVDGGSEDGSPEVARGLGAEVVVGCRRGRGPQLNAGAAASSADVIWFLHADALPPLDAVAAIRTALADPAVVGGAFHLHTVADAGGLPLGPLLRIADVRSRLTRLPYGDQGLFARRAAFDAAGGFPDQMIFEDLELSRRLWQHGRLVTVRSEIRVSGRRFQARPLYYLAVMNSFPTLYWAGISSERLARWYPHER